MAVDVLIGLQWGDEGKGKIVDHLAPQYDIVARFQGGPNAGHTLIFDNKKFVLHTLPSGIFQERPLNLIGNGVVIDPIVFEKEIENLKKAGIDIREKLFISKKAHLILPTHRILDAASEAAKGKQKIGSTLKGIGPAYMDKTGRNGLRVGDITTRDFRQKYEALKEKHFKLLTLYDFEFELKEEEEKWFNSIELLRQFNLVESEYFINDAIRSGKKILAEGAQGALLDVDFGTYPFVTSSNTITSGACKGLGIPPQAIGEVIGISKAYCTRVGGGPFPTELNDATGEKLQKAGNEFGSTTGRARRCGWIDLPALKYSVMINGVTAIALTKADVLNDFEEIKVCTHYKVDGNLIDELPTSLNEDVQPVYKTFKGWQQPIEAAAGMESMPREFLDFVEFIEKELQVKITLISTGPDRKQLIKAGMKEQVRV